MAALRFPIALLMAAAFTVTMFGFLRSLTGTRTEAETAVAIPNRSIT